MQGQDSLLDTRSSAIGLSVRAYFTDAAGASALPVPAGSQLLQLEETKRPAFREIRSQLGFNVPLQKGAEAFSTRPDRQEVLTDPLRVTAKSPDSPKGNRGQSLWRLLAPTGLIT